MLGVAADRVVPWVPPATERLRAGGVFVTFPRGGSGPGARGDPAWATAAVLDRERVEESVVVTGEAAAAYAPGLLALREARLLELAVMSLRGRPDVLLVNASGRDHPRRCGLALHLGAILDLPTVGVTDRVLLAVGGEPGAFRGDSTPLNLNGELVAMRVRTRPDVRPLVAHAAWRTDAHVAREVLLSLTGGGRTPEPLRVARRLARTARAGARHS